MAELDNYLKIERCPHCSIDNPNLHTVFNEFSTNSDNSTNLRYWRIYQCIRCGGVVTAWCTSTSRTVQKIYPEQDTIDDNLPERVKSYLKQAIESTFAPAGSIMLCASAVDAMLKEKGYKEDSLYTRIDKADTDGLLTKEMATWAHEVRLDANDQRHSDEVASLPTVEEAKQSIEFTKTLAEFLFVLPSKVKRGIESTKQETKDTTETTK